MEKFEVLITPSGLLIERIPCPASQELNLCVTALHHFENPPVTNIAARIVKITDSKATIVSQNAEMNELSKEQEMLPDSAKIQYLWVYLNTCQLLFAKSKTFWLIESEKLD